MRGIILLSIFLISLTGCGGPADDYNFMGTIKEVFNDEKKVLVELDGGDGDIVLTVAEQTELIGVEFEDFEIGDTIKMHISMILETEPGMAVPERIAKEN